MLVMSVYFQAHTFDEWCTECGCIHLDTVLKATEDITSHGDEQFAANESAIMSNLSKVLNRISEINS